MSAFPGSVIKNNVFVPSPGAPLPLSDETAVGAKRKNEDSTNVEPLGKMLRSCSMTDRSDSRCVRDFEAFRDSISDFGDTDYRDAIVEFTKTIGHHVDSGVNPDDLSEFIFDQNIWDNYSLDQKQIIYSNCLNVVEKWRNTPFQGVFFECLNQDVNLLDSEVDYADAKLIWGNDSLVKVMVELQEHWHPAIESNIAQFFYESPELTYEMDYVKKLAEQCDVFTPDHPFKIFMDSLCSFTFWGKNSDVIEILFNKIDSFLDKLDIYPDDDRRIDADCVVTQGEGSQVGWALAVLAKHVRLHKEFQTESCVNIIVKHADKFVSIESKRDLFQAFLEGVFSDDSSARLIPVLLAADTPSDYLSLIINLVGTGGSQKCSLSLFGMAILEDLYRDNLLMPMYDLAQSKGENIFSILTNPIRLQHFLEDQLSESESKNMMSKITLGQFTLMLFSKDILFDDKAVLNLMSHFSEDEYSLLRDLEPYISSPALTQALYPTDEETLIFYSGIAMERFRAIHDPMQFLFR